MNILWFKDCSYKNKNWVGGKNASLGELYHLSKKLNFNISNGFAVTTNLYQDFLKNNNIEKQIKNLIELVDTENLELLNKTSNEIKELFKNSQFSKKQEKEILEHFTLLKNQYSHEIEVAVRSSAISEDMPNASFAGQQDTFLNVKTEKELIYSIKECFGSLFNSRAISYRKTNNIDFKDVKISVGIQKMVRSDIGSAGVGFSIDPETGYDKAVVINSAFGLGELVVSGGVKPDEFIVDKKILKLNEQHSIIGKKLGHKDGKTVYGEKGIVTIQTQPNELSTLSLTEDQVISLAKTICNLEKNYSELFSKKTGIDVEWGLDGNDNKLYILQTRPETIHSNANTKLIKYNLLETSDVLISGVAVGEKISCGKIKVLKDVSEFRNFKKGEILVTSMTTPDWEPIMKISSGIVTDKGGRTCHAAIVARELGINAIVGTSNASNILHTGDDVTVCCSKGETGFVYNKELKYEIDECDIDTSKKLPIKLMLNVGSPELAFKSSMLPNAGVGLARMEFIINNYIKVHPKALIDYNKISDEFILMKISNILNGALSGEKYFIDRLSGGLGKIASAFYPNNVIVRLSDFKSNEYKNLIGGELYEPDEENPMIGWRGASRYYDKDYRDAFRLECLGIKKARDDMKLDNIIVMIPFCRTPEECEKVLKEMEKHGLVRGKNKLKVYLMCEIPSNVIEADEFAKYVDGVSIGGNDLLQLTLGIDRDSDKITKLSDPSNLSYRRMIKKAIETYKKYNVKVGFCGQQPSDSIEFCEFLIKSGIDSISVTSDSAIKTYHKLSNM